MKTFLILLTLALGFSAAADLCPAGQHWKSIGSGHYGVTGYCVDDTPSWPVRECGTIARFPAQRPFANFFQLKFNGPSGMIIKTDTIVAESSDVIEALIQVAAEGSQVCVQGFRNGDSDSVIYDTDYLHVRLVE